MCCCCDYDDGSLYNEHGGDHHASLAGSYLSALTHYLALTGGRCSLT